MKRINHWTYSASAALAIAAYGSLTLAAAAQDQVLRTPDPIRACLCMEQSLSRQAGVVGTANRDYEERRREVDTLDAAISEQRPKVNVNDPAAIDAFRKLLERRDDAAQVFANRINPDYRALIERYNRQVGDFNNSCSGKAYDPDVLAQVRTTLSCPVP